MPTTPPVTTTRSWREIVLKADGGDFHRESTYPVVYKFSNGVEKRDSGPQSGVYGTQP